MNTSYNYMLTARKFVSDFYIIVPIEICISTYTPSNLCIYLYMHYVVIRMCLYIYINL